MRIDTFVSIELRDKFGQLKSFKKQRANSPVRGLMDLLYCLMSNTQYTHLLDTTNTERTTQNPPSNVGHYFEATAGSGATTYGIVCGTGTNPVTVGDYALGTLIAHGGAAGQLNYGAVSVYVPATVSSTRKFTIVRTVNNSSGAQINVSELALYVLFYDSGSTLRYLCIDHTLNSFSVGNTLSATITYTVSVTVS